MQYCSLGNSALSISRVGFGCMSLGNDAAENTQLIDTAIAMGINFFDTADIYQQGQNETMLGKALKGKRKSQIIATKVGNQLNANGNGLHWNPRKAHILKAVASSLERLQTDYIDLYQLHGGTIEDPIDETIEAFEQLVQEGKIRYYGISSIRPNTIRAYGWRSNACSVMMQYSLLDRRPEETCLPFLKNKNIGVLARGSLCSGLLINKPAKSFLNYSEEQVSAAAKAIGQLATDKRSKTQVAINFVLHNPAITSAIVGIRTREQLNHLSGVFNNAPLSNIEMQALQSVLPLNYYGLHR